MTTPTKITSTGTMKITNDEGGSSMKIRRAAAENLDYDPRWGRPLKSAAEARAAIEKNHKEASKAAKRGWATRRRREHEIGIAAADAAARDSR